MQLLPQFRQIKAKDALQHFAKVYLNCSGLPIPDSYLYNPNNRVFGIYWKKALIGGFILGNGSEFRTINVFAKAESHDELYQILGEKSDYTEICCFWIKRQFRTKTALNIFVWLSMTYAPKTYGTKCFLFGTCSRPLARLYGQTPKSILIHEDQIKNKSTFVFWAKRSTCVIGMLEIIGYKLKRAFKISSGKSNRSVLRPKSLA